MRARRVQAEKAEQKKEQKEQRKAQKEQKKAEAERKVREAEENRNNAMIAREAAGKAASSAEVDQGKKRDDATGKVSLGLAA